MAQSKYNQFCPVAMAAEILCPRWTIVVLREMFAGSKRFNDLRRGVPRMSPALLSQRLKELEQAGIIERKKGNDTGLFEYHLTRSGRDLESIVMAFGVWGQRWVETGVTMQNLDASLLMWDMRRWLDPSPMPERRSVIEFLYSGAPKDKRHWWLVVTPGEGADLCSLDPGFDVDLYVACDVKTMTGIWMGLDSVRKGRQRRTPEAHRRSQARRQHANLAGIEPVRQGTKTRRLNGQPIRFSMKTLRTISAGASAR